MKAVYDASIKSFDPCAMLALICILRSKELRKLRALRLNVKHSQDIMFFLNVPRMERHISFCW